MDGLDRQPSRDRLPDDVLRRARRCGPASGGRRNGSVLGRVAQTAGADHDVGRQPVQAGHGHVEHAPPSRAVVRPSDGPHRPLPDPASASTTGVQLGRRPGSAASCATGPGGSSAHARRRPVQRLDQVEHLGRRQHGHEPPAVTASRRPPEQVEERDRGELPDPLAVAGELDVDGVDLVADGPARRRPCPPAGPPALGPGDPVTPMPTSASSSLRTPAAMAFAASAVTTGPSGTSSRSYFTSREVRDDRRP